MEFKTNRPKDQVNEAVITETMDENGNSISLNEWKNYGSESSILSSEALTGLETLAARQVIDEFDNEPMPSELVAEEVSPQPEEEQVVSKDVFMMFDGNDDEGIVEISEEGEVKNSSDVLRHFEKELKQIFEGHNLAYRIEGSQKDIESASASLDFDLTLYEVMQSKLSKETRLATNVNEFQVIIKIDEKVVSHIIDFELKEMAQKWAMVVSKTVSALLFHHVGAYQGTATCQHIYNLTTQKDICRLILRHQRLESFTGKEMGEKTITQSTLKRLSQNNLSF